jgi:hypothetical protein
MLRITVIESSVEQRWVLQGRLVEPWVNELRSSWKKSRHRHDNKRCIVDLSEVTLIGKSGEKMLRTMRRTGAELIACGVYTKHVVGKIQSLGRRLNRTPSAVTKARCKTTFINSERE